MTVARIQIYILSRDRPVYFRQALESALAQDAEGVEVVISDNSDQDTVQEMITSEFSHVRYIRRCPALPALAHFRTVIEESFAEFVVLFHDDDVLEPGYVRAMLQAMEQNPDVAAACCNAWIIKGEQRTQRTVMGFFNHERKIASAEELLTPYMTFMAMGPAPFPGYMYRRKFLHDLYLDAAHGGKYADVSFLMKVVERAPVLWIPQVLMCYRVHGTNDGITEAVGQRMSLLRYIYTHTNITRHSWMVAEFRFRYWVRWWRGARCSTYIWRKKVVSRYLLVTGFKFAILRPALWLRFLMQVR